jgi:hypothetical protein
LSISSRDIQEDFKKAIEVRNKDFLSRFQKEILEAVKSSDDMQLQFKKNMPKTTQDKSSKELFDSVKKQNLNINDKEVNNESEEKLMNGYTEEELNEVNEDTGLTKREEILKIVYQAAVCERHKLRSDIYERQIKDKDISIKDHNYLKLLEYDKYIYKIDLKFKSKTGKYISEEDKEIAKVEENQMYGDTLNEEALTKEHEKSVVYIRELNESIGKKADEILEVIDNMEDFNLDSSMEKYKVLHEEYMELNGKLQLATPSLNELITQEKRKHEQEDITKNNLGNYEENVNRVNQISGKDIDKQKEATSSMSDIQNDVTNQSDEIKEINKELAEKKIEKAEEFLQKDDLVDSVDIANKLVEDAKEISGVNDNIIDLDNDKEYLEHSNEIIDTNAKHKLDVVNDKDSYTNFQLECTNMTYTMVEANENQKTREEKEGKVKEKIQEVSKELRI